MVGRIKKRHTFILALGLLSGDANIGTSEGCMNWGTYSTVDEYSKEMIACGVRNTKA